MSRSRKGTTVVVAMAAVILLATTGCSDGDGNVQDDRAPKSRSASASSATDAPAAHTHDDAVDADKIPPGRKVPKSELTPATGSFTETEKEYLTNRVPEGVDPAAILEAGQEACDRIALIAKRDRAAAVSAIEHGEITGARDAITQLCPEHKPLLEASAGDPR